MSHGAPADTTGTAVGAPADPLALHGLGIALALAADDRPRIPVAAASPLTAAAAVHEMGETPHARGMIVLVN